MRYYLIFCKIDNHEGYFVCIVDNKEIAEDFCDKNPSYYFISNEKWERMKEEDKN